MKFAQPEQINEIMSIFRKYKLIFQHIRSDIVLGMINKGRVIFDSGVVITFIKYKRKTRLGTYTAQRGDCHLHQIVTEIQGNGTAQYVLNKFFKFVDSNIILAVKDDNIRAIKFYTKNGFKKVGNISWSKKNPIKGEIYKREYEKTV